jgi:hypothetical protein
MKRNYSIPTKFICDLNKPSTHLLKQPRKLPCGRNLCLECIEILASKITSFTCPFCAKEHLLVKDLRRNMMIENSLDEELEKICKYKKSELESKNQAIKELYNERNMIQSNKFDFIQNDIEVRVESLKICLEKLKIEINSKIDSIKTNLSSEFKRKEEKIQNNENIVPRLNQALAMRRNLNKLTIGIEINEQTSFAELNVESLVGNVSKFEANLFNLQKFSDQRYKPQSFRLDLNCCDLTLFTDGKYICIDSNQNGIFLLNKNLKFLNRIETIGETNLLRPKQIDYNVMRKVILVCTNLDTKNRILIIDRYFKEILYTINQCNSDSFFLEKEFLYILDFSTKCLNLFDMNITRISKTVVLFQDKPDECNIEHEVFSISFTPELIAVNFKREKISLYSTHTGSLHSILNRPSDSVTIHGICLTNAGIFIHLNQIFSDEIVFFQQDSDLNYFSSHSIKISEYGSLKGSNKLKLCGESLFLILWGKSLIIL